jgi:hypothetical protein
VVSDRFSRGEEGNRGMSYYRNILPLPPPVPHPHSPPPSPTAPILSSLYKTKPEQVIAVDHRASSSKRSETQERAIQKLVSNEKRKGKERKGKGIGKDCNASTRESGGYHDV